VESRTLSDLRALVRFYADERQAGFVEDASTSLDYPINDAAREVRSWVLSHPGGRAVWQLRETFELSSGTAQYLLDGSASTAGTDLQVDVLGEVSLEWTTTSKERIEPVSEADWERLNGGTWGQSSSKGYVQRATCTVTTTGVQTWRQAMVFAPEPSGTTIVAVTYVPSYRAMTATTDAIVGPDGYGKAVALSVAIQVRGMQDDSTTYLEKQLIITRESMLAAVSRRQGNHSPQVVDVDPESRWYDERWQLPPA